MAFATFTLTGDLHSMVDPATSPLVGTVTIQPVDNTGLVGPVLDSVGNQILAGGSTFQSEADGTFSRVLPDPNDGALNPTGFGYRVTVSTELLGRVLDVTVDPAQITALGPTVDLAKVTPVDPSTLDPTATYATLADFTALEETLDTQLSGIEKGYAERVTNFETSVGAEIPGLSVTVTGQGRPVDVEFYVPKAFHTATGTVLDALLVEGGANIIMSASAQSFSTTTGPNLHAKRRIVLDLDVEYTFTVNVLHNTAGTMTWWATPGRPMWLSVVSR